MRNIEAVEREPVFDKCGFVVGFSTEDVNFFADGLEGLHWLQTRGQDGAGVCVFDSQGHSTVHKGEGMIREVFSDQSCTSLRSQKGRLWVYQVRYGTNGAFDPDNVQPFVSYNQYDNDPFIIAHNGQFSDREGDTDTHLSDTAKFTRRLAGAPGDTWDERVVNALGEEKGAWSLVIGTKDGFYLSRDSRGVRPLAFGVREEGISGHAMWIAASETRALRAMGISHFMDVLPGEILRIDGNGFRKIAQLREKDDNPPPPASCVFEGIYIQDGASKLHQPRGNRDEINTAPTVDSFRVHCGTILAQEAPLSPSDVDIAIGVPGTGIAGGQAYAQALGIPYTQAITDRIPQDNPRTFMTADIDSILTKVLEHFEFDTATLKGKRIVLIDDSIVRGNIMIGLVRLLKESYGVAAVHIRILSPMIDKPCYLGVNTRKAEELIASRYGGDVSNVRVALNADSLAYLSTDALEKALGDHAKHYCYGCMAEHTAPIDRYGKSEFYE